MLNENNASTFHINIRDYQRSGETAWDLPTWNYQLAQGVMPLCAIIDNRLISIGTAFLISKLGIVATAAHVIQKALRGDPVVYRAIIRGSSSKEHSVKHVQIVVLHHRRTDEATMQVSVCPLENIQIVRPTDVALGFLRFLSFPRSGVGMQ